MKRHIFSAAILSVAMLASESLQAQNIPQLRCGQNVNCNDRGAVLNAMASAHEYMYGSRNVAVSSYQRMCADAYNRVANLNARIPFSSGIAQPQLDVCNAGLYEMHR